MVKSFILSMTVYPTWSETNARTLRNERKSPAVFAYISNTIRCLMACFNFKPFPLNLTVFYEQGSVLGYWSWLFSCWGLSALLVLLWLVQFLCSAFCCKKDEEKYFVACNAVCLNINCSFKNKNKNKILFLPFRCDMCGV